MFACKMTRHNTHNHNPNIQRCGKLKSHTTIMRIINAGNYILIQLCGVRISGVTSC